MIAKSVIRMGAKAHDIPLVLNTVRAIVVGHKTTGKPLKVKYYIEAVSNLAKLEAFDFKLIS